MPFKVVWQRWKELTQFRLACEMALSSYRKTLKELPIFDTSKIKIFEGSGISKFECGYSEFLDALADGTQLYRLLLVAHASLVEEFGRAIVAGVLNNSLRDRGSFPNIGKGSEISDVVDEYIMRTPVEIWGRAILLAAGKEVNQEYEGLVVHAFVIRNIVAHGGQIYTERSINRLRNVNFSSDRVTISTSCELTKESFLSHLAVLRDFSREICGAYTAMNR